MEKYCGVDVHKKRFNAAIVRKDMVVDTGEFTNDFMGATEFVSWLRSNGCSKVAMESTGPYWIGLYDVLKVSGIEVVVANPAYTKAIAGKRRTGHITKKGTPHLRRVLCEAAEAIHIQGVPELQAFYWRIRAKKGAKVANVALARKLLVVVHTMLTRGEEFNKCREELTKKKIKEMEKMSSAEYPTLMQVAEKLRMVDLLPKVKNYQYYQDMGIGRFS